MFVKTLAAIGLCACLLLLVRMALPLRRRQTLDARLREALGSLRRWPWRLRHGRQVQRDAADAAQQAIQRARRPGERRPQANRDGNVARPDAFGSRPPRSRKDLH